MLIAKYSNSNKMRIWAFRKLGMTIGKGVTIKKGLNATTPSNITIGDGCWINYKCTFHTFGDTSITIGNNVVFAPEVMLMCSSHEIGPSLCRAGTKKWESIFIGDGTWIGTRATVLPGVHIGKGCVIGAMALVNKTINDNSISVGIPAKTIHTLE